MYCSLFDRPRLSSQGLSRSLTRGKMYPRVQMCPASRGTARSRRPSQAQARICLATCSAVLMGCEKASGVTSSTCPAKNSVSTRPGLTTETAIPLPSNSSANDKLKAQTELRSTIGRRATAGDSAGQRSDIDDAPPPARRKCGITMRHSIAGAFRFTSIICATSSTEHRSSGPRTWQPALLTRMSIPPKRVRVCSSIASMPARSVTSAATTNVRSVPISREMVSSMALRLATRTTRAPSEANWRAVAAPIPEDAPVMMTRLSTNRPVTHVPCHHPEPAC